MWQRLLKFIQGSPGKSALAALLLLAVAALVCADALLAGPIRIWGEQKITMSSDAQKAMIPLGRETTGGSHGPWIGEPLAANIVLGWFSLLPLSQPLAVFYAHVIAIALGFSRVFLPHANSNRSCKSFGRDRSGRLTEKSRSSKRKCGSLPICPGDLPGSSDSSEQLRSVHRKRTWHRDPGRLTSNSYAFLLEVT